VWFNISEIVNIISMTSALAGSLYN